MLAQVMVYCIYIPPSIPAQRIIFKYILKVNAYNSVQYFEI